MNYGKNAPGQKEKVITAQITIIASASKAENDLLTNYVNHKTAIQTLANFGLKAKEAVGSYEGKQELSLVIDLEDNINTWGVQKTSKMSQIKCLFFGTFKQDAILLINGTAASLVFADDDSEELGKFKTVPEAEAKENGSFTFLQGEYWIAKKENLPVWGERQSV
jgi:hypothetical protein